MKDFKLTPTKDGFLVERISVNPELEKIGKEFQKMTARLFIEKNEKRNSELEKQFRANVVPPIKGEITKGKLKWRGIVYCSCLECDPPVSWIEQRGKRITDKL